MTKVQEPVNYERRHGPDWVCRVFNWLAVLGWLLFIACLIVAHYASPEMDTGLVRYWGIEVREDWHPTLTAYLQYLLGTAALVGAASLILNRMRLRRRGDHLHFNTAILLLTSIGILLYVVWQA